MCPRDRHCTLPTPTLRSAVICVGDGFGTDWYCPPRLINCKIIRYRLLRGDGVSSLRTMKLKWTLKLQQMCVASCSSCPLMRLGCKTLASIKSFVWQTPATDLYFPIKTPPLQPERRPLSWDTRLARVGHDACISKKPFTTLHASYWENALQVHISLESLGPNCPPKRWPWCPAIAREWKQELEQIRRPDTIPCEVCARNKWKQRRQTRKEEEW